MHPTLFHDIFFFFSFFLNFDFLILVIYLDFCKNANLKAVQNGDSTAETFKGVNHDWWSFDNHRRGT